MYFVHLVLRNPDLPQPSTADAEYVRHMLWDGIETRSLVEHIRSRPFRHGVNLGLFFRDDIASADALDLILDQYIGWLLTRLPGWTVVPPTAPGCDR